MEKVSIVIVSMNKLNNLEVCLPSIKKYTELDYKVYLVAYLFSKENLAILRKKYPDVFVIESNEIRGFSENNNLALKQVKGEYTFILNDDTEFREPVLDKLLKALECTPEASIMSPVLIHGDGSLQYNGRRKYTLWGFIKEQLGFKQPKNSKYENGIGVYKSYNISGAAFLIKTSFFKKMGFFDEKYFFSPEDIVLSTLINKKGYGCFVDANTTIVHYEGVSSRKGKLFYATTSTAQLGMSYFYGHNLFRRLLLLTLWKFKSIYFDILYCFKQTEHTYDFKYIYNTIYKAYLEKKSTKGLFIEEYRKV